MKAYGKLGDKKVNRQMPEVGTSSFFMKKDGTPAGKVYRTGEGGEVSVPHFLRNGLQKARRLRNKQTRSRMKRELQKDDE